MIRLFLFTFSFAIFTIATAQVHSNIILGEYDLPGNIYGIAYHEPSGKFALISHGNSLYVKNTITGEVKRQRKKTAWLPMNIEFDRSGEVLYSYFTDGTIKSWNLNDPNKQRLLFVPGPVYAMCSSPVEDGVLAALFMGELRIYNFPESRKFISIKLPNLPTKNMAWSPDGKTIAISHSANIYLVDVKTRQVSTIESNAYFHQVAFTPESKYIVACTDDNSLNVYDNQARKLVYRTRSPVLSLTNRMLYHSMLYVDQGQSKVYFHPLWNPSRTDSLVASIPGMSERAALRNQFETEDEFAKRRLEFIKEYALALFNREAEEVNRIETLRRASLRETVLESSMISLGAYNIASGAYPVRVHGRIYTFNLPREEARSLYENREIIRVEAISRLKENLEDVEYLNLVLYHPMTGQSYPLGEHTDIGEVGGLATLPSALIVSELSFADHDGDNLLSAGEKAVVQFTVTNEGPGVAYLVRIEGDATAPIHGLQGSLGNIDPGEQRSVLLSLEGDAKLEDGQAVITLNIKEFNGFHADPVKLIVGTKGFEKPHLIISELAVEDAQGRPSITPGVLADITLRISNQGRGHAQYAQAEITPGEGVFLAAVPNPTRALLSLGEIKAGTFKDITFQAFCNRDATHFPLKITLMDKHGGQAPPDMITLELNQPQRSYKELVISAREFDRKLQSNPSVLTAEIALDIPEAAEVNPNAVAVIIGNRNYHGSIPPVAYALNDAQMVKRYVELAMGYKPGNILYLEDLTLTGFKVHFGDVNNPNGRLKDIVKPGLSDVFVYYSGHGAPDPNAKTGYLMPVDSDVNRLSLTGFSLDVFYTNLATLGARSVTVVLDACFSGISGGGEMLIAQASPIGIRINNPTARLGEKAAIITASSGQQVASWYPEMRHGLLTWYFLKGLKGDADANADGVITLGEMQQWLHDPTEGLPYMARRLHAREQNPEVWGNKNHVLR